MTSDNIFQAAIKGAAFIASILIANRNHLSITTARSTHCRPGRYSPIPAEARKRRLVGRRFPRFDP
jgi:hypothetical protein